MLFRAPYVRVQSLETQRIRLHEHKESLVRATGGLQITSSHNSHLRRLVANLFHQHTTYLHHPESVMNACCQDYSPLLAFIAHILGGLQSHTDNGSVHQVEAHSRL